MVLAAGLTGCASFSLRDQPPAVEVKAEKAPEQRIEPGAPVALQIRGISLENSRFDIPIAVNSRVLYWIDYFTGTGRKYFAKYLERSDYFIPYIQPLLRQNGLPEDLVYLAMIESGFHNHARSSAKAVGPWQFITGTGKRHGLAINWWVDERRDTRKSTIAAAMFLRDLYGMFNSWELAAAAYNAGEFKIARAIQRYGTKDFWELARHRFLRPETRDYVPKIMAAAIVAKNRTQFGFAPIQSLASMKAPDEIVAGDGEVVKVEKAAAPAPETDPAGDGPTSVKEALKKSDIGAVATASESGVSSRGGRPLAVPTPHVSKAGEVGGVDLVEFDLQSPADLLKVSSAAGLSYTTVKALNPELLRWCTPPNAPSYRIKLPASVKDQFLATYNSEQFPRRVEFLTYKVRKGESLSYIARHFGLRLDPIADLNRVHPKVALRNGQNVLLPMPNDRSRTLASLEIRDTPDRRRRSVSASKRKPSGGKYYRVTYKRREAARVRPNPGRPG